jgi:two-component system, LytTR family, response regulator
MNQKIKTLIVEDEPESANRLKILLSKHHPDVDVVGCATQIQSTADLLETHKPELVFLDIQLSDHDAFFLLRNLKELDFSIIFTTAHQHFALPAIKFNPVDYLLKPIDRDDLAMALGKFCQFRNRKEETDQKWALMRKMELQFGNPKIAIPTSTGLEYIYVKEICRCLADGNYTILYFRSGQKLLVSKTLKSFEDLLTPYGFFRVHNSHLINLQEVRAYQKGKGGHLILHDNSEIEVASRRKEELLLLLKQI